MPMARPLVSVISLIAVCLLIQLSYRAAECADSGSVPTQDHKTSEVRTWLDGLLQGARTAVDDLVNPKQDYLGLFKRLHGWYTKYKALYDKQQPETQLLAPLELMAVEFAQVDREIQHELDSEGGLRQKIGDNGKLLSNGVDSNDYVYEILERIIEKLESLNLHDLDQLERDVSLKLSLNGGRTLEEMKASKEFQSAMEHMKAIGVQTARGALQNEAFAFMRLFLIQLVATQLLLLPGTQMVASPFVLKVLSSFNGPILLKYMSNVQHRLVANLIKSLNIGKLYRQGEFNKLKQA